MIAEALGRIQPASTRALLLEEVAQRLEDPAALLQQFNDPRGLYARLPFEIRLN